MIRDGSRVLTLPGALASEDAEGRRPKAWAGAKLPNKVPIDYALLDTYATHLQRYARTGGRLIADTFAPFQPEELETINYQEGVASRLIGLSNNTLCERRCVSIRYQEKPCGRAFAMGVNLQNAPRVVREAALHGNWDIDLSNCHYAQLLQLAAKLLLDLPEVRWYLANKRAVRTSLATRVGITYDEAKTCLISLIYGARFTLWGNADIPQLVGKARARKLYADPQFRALRDDVKRARDAILLRVKKGAALLLSLDQGKSLRAAEIKQDQLFNAAGRSIHAKETEGRRKGKWLAPSKLLAHILLGLEAKIMRVVVDACPDDVLLLMHDGFVARRELPSLELEDLIWRNTGLRMTLDQEQMVLPDELRALGKCFGAKRLSHMENPAIAAQ